MTAEQTAGIFTLQQRDNAFMSFFNHFLFLIYFLFWQEHLEVLEVEKEELGQEITLILLENQGLVQLKMSLGLEVATYRYFALTAALYSSKKNDF